MSKPAYLNLQLSSRTVSRSVNKAGCLEGQTVWRVPGELFVSTGEKQLGSWDGDRKSVV